MSSQVTGIILGGIAPAFLLGVFAILQKLSMNTGAAIGTYLLFVAAGVLLVAVALLLLGHRGGVSTASIGASLATGVVWAIAVTLIAVAQSTYGARVSTLVPLFNMNTLVAVLLGFLVFAEWRGVHVPRLALGTVLVVVGGTLVATA